jgi:transcriptional regulator with XRE-family HTH domain
MAKSERQPGLVEQIREAVRQSGLSLKELGKRCGVDHGRLSRFLRSERTLTLPAAASVCETLGLRLCGAPGAVPASEVSAPKRARGRKGKGE